MILRQIKFVRQIVPLRRGEQKGRLVRAALEDLETTLGIEELKQSREPLHVLVQPKRAMAHILDLNVLIVRIIGLETINKSPTVLDGNDRIIIAVNNQHRLGHFIHVIYR